MVIPATKVVYTTVPNHVPNEVKCKTANACFDKRLVCDPAAAAAAKRAKERNQGVL
jgi:hypothetical protein